MLFCFEAVCAVVWLKSARVVNHRAGIFTPTLFPTIDLLKRLALKVKLMNLDQCHMIDLPRVTDQRGNLTFIESNRHVPFDIKRVYYIYDVPGGAERGGHAHKNLEQFIFAPSGSFDVVLSDGRSKRKFSLNRSYYGLYIRSMIWREINNFSSGSVCMALASAPYSEDDYYREYSKFLEAVGKLREENV